MKTVVYTSFPCLVKFGDCQETLSPNENLVFDEEFEKLSIYPTEKGKISFEVNINEQESSFYRIIERENKRLVFLIDGLYAENAEICEFEYKGIKSKIEIYPQKVIFSNSSNKKIVHLSHKYDNIKFGNIKYIDFCLIKNNDGENSLLAYNVKKNTAKVFNASKIEQDKDEFILTSSAFGYASITQYLYIDEEGLKVRNKDFVQSSSILSPQETLPFQFMNSVKFGDYQKSLSMLSPTLNDRLSDESLKAYFGNISYFYMIDYKTAYAISNDKNTIYEFQVKDNKICEISSE